ncbi:hypothetical protein H0N99_04985 [Candidatus Micrarchaeota archaeon]|nr:hypothetical protein [Candidatus Micrarchaeota archaeon]
MSDNKVDIIVKLATDKPLAFIGAILSLVGLGYMLTAGNIIGNIIGFFIMIFGIFLAFISEFGNRLRVNF